MCRVIAASSWWRNLPDLGKTLRRGGCHQGRRHHRRGRRHRSALHSTKLRTFDNNPNCLDEPEPLIVFKGFGDSALEFLFGVWFAKADFLQVRNSIQREMKERFDKEGIEIPFPHRTLYTGDVTAPFPIRLVTDPVPSAAEPPVPVPTADAHGNSPT